MSNNIVPFDINALSAPGTLQLPEHLRQLAEKTGVNMADLVTGGGFPVMSIKGKNWTLKRDGEAHILMNPLDPNSPASAIEVVIIRASNVVTKTYYAGSYVDGSDEKPTCFSNDGALPSKDSPKKQAAACAECPWNQWGSRQNSDGTRSDGKACQDNKRLAIATPDATDDPFMLRIPPSSFKAMTAFSNLLSRKNIPYNAVVTKLRFNPEAPTPELMFEPVGFLSAEAAASVAEQYDSPLIQEIVGLLDIDRANTVTDAEKAAHASSAMAQAEQSAMAQAEAAAQTAATLDPRAATATATTPMYWVNTGSRECGAAINPREAQMMLDSGCQAVDKGMYDRFAAALAGQAHKAQADGQAAQEAAAQAAAAKKAAEEAAAKKAAEEAAAKKAAEEAAAKKAAEEAAAATAATAAVATAMGEEDPEMAALLREMEWAGAAEPQAAATVEKTLPNATVVSGDTLEDALSALGDLDNLGLDG